MIMNKILTFPLLAVIFICGSQVWAAEGKNYFADGNVAPKANLYDAKLGKDLVYRTAFGRAGDVQILLDQGANPQSRNIADVPVLLIAIARKDAEAPKIVESILKAGANVNSVSKTGDVAVLEAVKNGRPDILQILIDHHAVLSVVHDVDGSDLLSIAEARGNLDIVKILNAGLENEKDKFQSLRSEENFINLIQQYAFLSCANEYLNFYISDQPKNINMVAFSDVISGNSNEIADIGGQIKMLFKTSNAELQQIQSAARGEIVGRLNNYETNENRALNGVGTDDDLNGRCRKIAAKWNANRLNLKQYRQSIK